MLRLLVIEDTLPVRQRIVAFLTEEVSGFEVGEAGSREGARRALWESRPDLLLLDLAIPAEEGGADPHWRRGLEVLRLARQEHPRLPIIALTGIRDVEIARPFFKEGLKDYFLKDSEADWRQGKLLVAIEECIGYVPCRSPAMQAVRHQLAEAAETNAPVFLHGEPGVGKKYLAHVLHRGSERGLRRLEWLPCATLTDRAFLAQMVGSVEAPGQPGLLGEPHVGTILLDQLENLSPGIQKQLAGILAGFHSAGLEYRPVGGTELQQSDVRWILTARDDPATLQARGQLTPELNALLNPEWGGIAHVIAVPPLRERPEDVPELAEFYRARFALDYEKDLRGVADDCLDLLRSLPWPGNVAQLRGVLEEAVRHADGEVLESKHLRRLHLPNEYAVTYSLGEGPQREKVSRKELAQFTDPARFDLILFFRRDAPPQVTANGRPVQFTDERLLKVLSLLLQMAPGVVDLRRHARELGLAPKEPIRRCLAALRRALHDQRPGQRESQFFVSHYREQYAVNPTLKYVIIRPLNL